MGKKLNKRVKKQLLNILFLAILIGITLIIVFVVNKGFSFKDLGIFLKGCSSRWYWLLAAFAASALFVVFEGVSLFFILRGLGEKPRVFSSMVYSSADVYYSAITPSATGGQPASAYYMVKDGIGAGKSSFALVFNLIGYTTAILIIGFTALILRPSYFGAIDNWFMHLLIILGFVLQGLLLAFFIACMFCGGAVKKMGNGLISLLVKLHIVKKPEKWRKKLADEVEKYKECRQAIRTKPLMTVANFFFNLLQRVSHVLVSCFVCMAAAPEAHFIDLFVLESFVLVGYNSIPLPGGVGAFESLYINIYCVCFPAADNFILSAMMVTRFISYYLRMIVCGIITLGYHVHLVRKIGKENFSRENEEINGEYANESREGEQT